MFWIIQLSPMYMTTKVLQEKEGERRVSERGIGRCWAAGFKGGRRGRELTDTGALEARKPRTQNVPEPPEGSAHSLLVTSTL